MPSSPCGMCRQFLREFCPLDMPIFMYGRAADSALSPHAPDSKAQELTLTLEDVSQYYPRIPIAHLSLDSSAVLMALLVKSQKHDGTADKVITAPANEFWS